MGYYTKYDFYILKKETNDYRLSFCEKKERDQVINRLFEISEDARYAINEDGNPIKECKWYGHEKDILHVSVEFPDVIMALHGEGEERTDCWRKYFKNGKVQYCQAEVFFEKYDENKLVKKVTS